MPGRIADGHDFFEVYEAFGEASERARKGEALPSTEHKLDRFYGHFEGDNQNYRAEGEVQKLREETCCIKGLQQLQSPSTESSEPVGSYRLGSRELIDEAVKFAESSPDPSETDLTTDVYINY